MNNIYIRDIKIEDLDDYFLLNHPDREHHKFNGPYFASATEDELRERIQSIKTKLENKESNPLGNNKIIANVDTNEIIGRVNWYWKSIETLWLEVGIVIFNENYWNRGIATKALKEWVNQVFDDHPEIVRIGLTTWSGNIGMCKVAEKIGLIQEACYRKARIVNNKFYDSVSYGILREEWSNRY
ncbi:MAG: GNAT family N-acetyltransferase [Defluviitaleaceae bacterium]|nr:GNAT family N-acetyltransferase [Defluviitaleaceae bacterium]